MTGPLLPADVQRYLAAARIGRRLYYHPETNSTNDVAIELARDGEPEGAVVYTDYQRAGRGRLDHVWSSPPRKDLLFSVILRPGGEPRGALAISLAFSVAVAVALSKTLDADIGVDWPNDVVSPLGKIAGILAEGATQLGRSTHAVVGIGINVNTVDDDFPSGVNAASCRTISGEEMDRALLFADVLGTIDTYYQRFCADGFESLRTAYEERLVIRNRDIKFERDGVAVSARAIGVTADGALRVQRGDAEEILYSETVTG